jgi:GNAT superfamily N-acetyltransferase
LWIDRRAFFDQKKNPFYRTADTALFVAYRNGVACGRIGACVNRDHNTFHETKTGSFGFFECEPDQAVATALLDTVAEWVAARGMDTLLGPLSFSTNHEVGFLTDAFDTPPMVMMSYNPPYYLDLVESWGMAKAKDMWAFKMDGTKPPPERVRRIAERVRQRANVTIRSIRLSEFEAEIDRIREIYNQAWSKNWGFVPLGEDEFQHIAKDMKLIIKPNWALMAEVEGRPIGFSLTLPNVFASQIRIRSGRLLPTGIFRLLWDLKVRKSTSARVITMGVIHDYQKRGIESVFYIDTFDRTTADGIEWGELSWVLEDNEMMIRAAEAMGAFRYKTYRVFGKTL